MKALCSRIGKGEAKRGGKPAKNRAQNSQAGARKDLLSDHRRKTQESFKKGAVWRKWFNNQEKNQVWSRKLEKGVRGGKGKNTPRTQKKNTGAFWEKTF